MTDEQMTAEQFTSSDDVDLLYSQLQAARKSGDRPTVRRIEARMRELAGANTRADGRGSRVAVDERAFLSMKARVQQGEGGGA